MFSDEVLEKIFARKELQSLDLSTQSSIIHAIEDVLEEVKQDEYERSLMKNIRSRLSRHAAWIICRRTP